MGMLKKTIGSPNTKQPVFHGKFLGRFFGTVAASESLVLKKSLGFSAKNSKQNHLWCQYYCHNTEKKGI